MKKTVIRSTTLLADIRLWPVYAVLAALAAYYKLLWAFVLVALPLAYLLWSWLWTYLGSRRLTVDDPLAQTALFAGDALQLNWHFENTWRITLARSGLRLFMPEAFVCTSQDNLSTTRQEPSETTTASDILPTTWAVVTAQWPLLAPKEQRCVSLTINAPLRGSYYLPPVRVFSGDPSGLYEGFCQTGQPHYLSVFPALKSTSDVARALSFDENLLEDMLGLDDPYQAIGVREYETGDSPKSINWYATARTASVKSNFYQRQISAACIVALDVSSGFVPVSQPHMPRKAEPRLEEAISLASSIALSQLERGIKTTFVTNAPTLQWAPLLNRSLKPDDFNVELKRNRDITLLEGALGTEQERRILELCASIDDTSRATSAGQASLWAQLMQIPPQTAVYLLCYHTMPEHWQVLKSIENQREVTDPAAFYTPGRLAGLPTTLVRMINLSQQGASE